MTRTITFHGGAPDLIEKMFPGAPKPWVDLSTGINPVPYPYSRSARNSAFHLPTLDKMDQCVSAMASAIHAPSEYVTLAPGSELLIRLIPTVLRAERVAVVEHSYADHLRAWSDSGAKVIAVPDPLERIDDCDLIVICNPNNPDGRTWSPERLRTAYRAMADKGGYLVIDEAYADLHLSLSLAQDAGAEGLLILRSIGKFYGLAGIRLGAMLCPCEIQAAMSQRLGVWPVPGPTLDIATEAYRDLAWQKDTRSVLASNRARLDKLLSGSVLEVMGGTDLFRFVKTRNAGHTWESLAKQGIYVRKFDWSETCLRLGLPSGDQEYKRLRKAVEQLTL